MTHLPHDTQDGPAEDGDDVPLGPVLPFSASPHLEAVALCRRLLQRFELEVSDEDLSHAVAVALPRSEFRYGRFEGQEEQRIGCAREFLKVLLGETLMEATRRVVSSHEHIDERSYQAVQRHLSPTPDAHDLGQYFDPRSWDVGLVEANGIDAKVYRLALFVEGMLDQEQGLREAGATVLEAAERAVQDRS